MFSKLLQSKSDEELAEAFYKLHSEEDEIDWFEFRQFLHSLEIPISMSDVQQIFDAVDEDASGLLSFEEAPTHAHLLACRTTVHAQHASGQDHNCIGP